MINKNKIIVNFERLNKITNYTLFCSCALLPFSFQISTIAIALFSFLSILYNVNTGFSFREKKLVELFKLPLLLFLIPLIGFLFTAYKEETIKLLIKYLPYLLLSLVYFFSNDGFKCKARKYVLYGIIVGTLAVSLYLFFVAFHNFSINDEKSLLQIFSYKYTYNNFLKPIDSHPTYLGLLFIMSNFFVNELSLKKRMKLVVFFINFITILFITSKIIIALYLVQVLLFLFFVKNKQIKRTITLFLLILIASFFYLYKNNLKEMYFLQRLTIELKWDLNKSNVNSSINGRNSDDSRISRWEAIIEKAEESILLGFGSGSEDIILPQVYKDSGLNNSLERKYNTHNQYLFFIVENGILGLIIFICFISLNIIEAINKRDYLMLFYTVSLALICFFENYFNRTMGVLAISIFLTFLKKTDEKNNFSF